MISKVLYAIRENSRVCVGLVLYWLSHPIQDDMCEDDQLRLLLEMFPSSCVVEAQKCLTIAKGDMEHATQIMLDKQLDETQAMAHHEVTIG